jgi:hypothetical protein
MYNILRKPAKDKEDPRRSYNHLTLKSDPKNNIEEDNPIIDYNKQHTHHIIEHSNS